MALGTAPMDPISTLGAANASTATRLINHNSGQHVQVSTTPGPPPSPEPPAPNAPAWSANWNLTESRMAYVEPSRPVRFAMNQVT